MNSLIIIPEEFKKIKDKCCICHKDFKRTSEWAYKVKVGYKTKKFFCSYTCFRVYQKEQQRKFETKYADDFKGVTK